MLIKCSEIGVLTAQEMDRALTVREHVRVFLHRVFCPPCRAYRRQLIALRQRARDIGASFESQAGAGTIDGAHRGDSGARLNDEARARLRERLKNPPSE